MPSVVPKHIAIILDGNGRWAKKRMMPRVYGHRHGAFNIEKIAKYASSLGVEVLSLYCFSTENWRRPNDEVNYLMKLPIKYFKRYYNKIVDNDYRILFSGRRTLISEELLKDINNLEENTKNKKGLIINICFDYGSQQEISDAVLKIHHDLLKGVIKEEDVTPNLINHYMYQDLPLVDLMIRTSGEERLSNFMLWQNAYSEFYFTDVLWPDFNERELDKAILAYNQRNRRFGGLKDETKNNN